MCVVLNVCSKQGTPGRGCLSDPPDHPVTLPWKTALLFPLFPRAQIRRTPSAAFESTTPTTNFRIRSLLQFEAFWSHCKPFSINNSGTFDLLLGLGLSLSLSQAFPPSFTAESCLNEIDFDLCGSNLAPFSFLEQMVALSVAPVFGYFLERFGCRFYVLGIRWWFFAAMGIVGFCTRRAKF